MIPIKPSNEVTQQQTISESKAQFELYSHLAQSQDDIKLGRIQNANSVFDELKSEISNIDL